ncbi:MAG: DUF4058 family protein [Hormoscilla sp. SP5CHS1]|nr:DUF4058 family protein [Hormoscilla sp. SP12CHS1]MBC6452635.1 DUF4058 family protein [Hormoscilla sp. SP5CHS1]
MPSPFPGMNPYLENPRFWHQIHKWLTILIAEIMNPKISPKYWVSVEERVYQTTGNSDGTLLVGIPGNVVIGQSRVNIVPPSTGSVAIAAPSQPVKINLPMPETVKEWYLEVLEVETEEVITVIEIISPKNKQAGEGRKSYMKKREKILGSSTHLIEIDLLRMGKPMPMLNQDLKTHYRIVVSRSQTRPMADLYAFNLQQEIPSIPLPLQAEDEEPLIPLQSLLHTLYDRGSYDLRVDYKKKPTPALSTEDDTWANQLLSTLGLQKNNPSDNPSAETGEFMV